MAKKNKRELYWGLIVSLVGSLPPGIINMVALQIAGKSGYQAAIIYATGSMVAEVVIVRMVLLGLNWISRSRRLFVFLEWTTALLLLFFSAGCLINAGLNQEITLPIPILVASPFVAGFLLSMINPFHIPFWIGWSTVMTDKGILLPKSGSHNLFVAGIGIGTMIGFMLFIHGGRFLVSLFENNYPLFYSILGLGSMVIAFVQLRKLIRVPARVRYARLTSLKE